MNCNHKLTIFLFTIKDRLLKKLGAQAHAFSFSLPTTAPASIVLQEGGRENDAIPLVGVEYDFMTFVGENADDRSHKRSSVSMAIRKVCREPLHNREETFEKKLII
jgi:hypothetical protein